jgi:hypothetical protein
MDLKVNIKMIVSIIIVLFLSLIVLNHFFKDFFKLNPYYRNKILLEGFDASVTDASVTDVSGNATKNTSVTAPPLAPPLTTPLTAPLTTPLTATAMPLTATTLTATSMPLTATAPPLTATAMPLTATAMPLATEAPLTATAPPLATAAPLAPPSANEIPDADKSTIIVDLFEKVNTHKDIIRTILLSNKLVPINIDKTAPERYAILENLKLLINNGIYTNEINLKEIYNQYIGNKSIQVLTSDINSVNMESTNTADIGSLETSFLKRCQSIVAAHQIVIDKLLEKKSKE